uniref:Arf-GAP domain-containing protein n=1 Tax=Mesocestoides corti TaxID=53468 RepID=A0A5K3FMR8_MESCO
MSASRQGDKQQIERLQLIIAEIVKDEENKYCADCDAKGPRWASWNLGVLLCIRCAGIHRGLGVHISKVKSLNLDSWDIHQVAMLKDVGNRRARQIYEANLPEFFRRPQTDSALEQFIRAKYEQRRYVASDFSPPKPDVESLKKELLRLEQQSKKRATTSRFVNLPLQNGEALKPQGRTLKSIAKPDGNDASGTADILGLSSSAKNQADGDDLSALKAPQNPPGTPQQTAKPAAPEHNSFSADLLGINFGEVVQPSGAATVDPAASLAGDSSPGGGGGGSEQRSTKESILALYALSKPPISQVGASGSGLFQPTPNQPNGQNAPPSVPVMFSASGAPGYLPSRPAPAYQASPSAANFDWTVGHAFQPSSATAPSNLLGPGGFQGSLPQSTAQSSFAANSIGPHATSAAPSTSDLVFSPHQFNASPSPHPVAAASVNLPTAAAAAAINSTQQSYLVQIQNQLASMQARSSVIE